MTGGQTRNPEGKKLRVAAVAAMFLIFSFIVGGLVFAAYNGYSTALRDEEYVQQEQDIAQLLFLVDRGTPYALAVESEALAAPHGHFMLLDGKNGDLLASASSRGLAPLEGPLVEALRESERGRPALGSMHSYKSELAVGKETYLVTVARHDHPREHSYLIVYASPQSLVLAPARETLRLMIITGASVLGFFTALAWLLGLWITAPIMAINEAVRELSTGNLNVSVPARNVGELGILSRSFNDMVRIVRGSIESMAQSERKKQALIDALPDMIFVNRKDGTYVDYHVKDPSLLAVPPEKFLGRRISEVSPPMLADIWEKLVRDATETGLTQNCEYDISVGGRVMRYESRTVPYGPDHALTVSRDVTDLRASERKALQLASAVEQAADSIIITDANGTVTYVNPSFTRITGVSEAEAVGSPFPLAAGRNDSPSFLEWRKIPAGSRTQWRGRLVNSFGGRELVLEVSIAPIRDAAGKVLGFVSAQRDVTRETELEAGANRARRLEALGRLAGGISHDFNNLLVAIAGYTDLCVRQNEDPRIDEDLLAIKKAAARAADLVRQIMAFGKVGARDERPVRPSRVVHEVVSLFKPAIPPDVETIVSFADEPVVVADPTDLHRVLVNLVTNAMHAMRRGGGVLSLSVDRFDLGPEFRAVYEVVKPGPHCRITVADTGRGMSPEALERAFEPFFSDRGGGEPPSTGMGLAVAHGLVTAMNGVITVASKPGEGATFEIYLPIADLEEEEGTVDPDERPMEGDERLLVVDDDEQVLSLAAKALPRYGYRVTRARSAEEALALFYRAPDEFDAVVADFKMGGMDGVEMACRMMTARPGLPVVVMTGQGNRDSALAAKALGVAEYVIKPVSMEYLTILVRRAVDARGSGGVNA